MLLAYLVRVRPDGVLPRLWAWFDAAEPGTRSGLIRVLPRFGGPEVTGELAGRFGGMTSAERLSALAVFGEVDPERLVAVAGDALADPDTSVVTTAVQRLMTLPNGLDAFEPLVVAFGSSANEEFAELFAQVLAYTDLHGRSSSWASSGGPPRRTVPRRHAIRSADWAFFRGGGHRRPGRSDERPSAEPTHRRGRG